MYVALLDSYVCPNKCGYLLTRYYLYAFFHWYLTRDTGAKNA